MRKIVLLLTVALIGFTPALVRAADPAPSSSSPASSSSSTPSSPGMPFTDEQRTEIEAIIKDYLVNKHPEVMSDGLQNLQKREQEEAEAKTTTQISKDKDKIYNDPHSPVAGNPKGDVTVVEFYDFNCGYCKMSEEGLERLVKEDKNVKIIYKDFPILGPYSVEASKAALASVKQGKFQVFHDALMSKKDHISASDQIYMTARDVGIDVDKLKKDMLDSSISEIISDNMNLGSDIGVRGTPMFIVNDKVSPGALQYDQLKKIVDDARADKKKL